MHLVSLNPIHAQIYALAVLGIDKSQLLQGTWGLAEASPGGCWEVFAAQLSDRTSCSTCVNRAKG